MPLNNPRCGFNFAPEYQSSGIPWSLASVATSGSFPTKIEFPSVTKSITVYNNDTDQSSSLSFAFTKTDIIGTSNKFILQGGQSTTIDLRVKEMYVQGETGTPAFSLNALLTSIDKSMTPAFATSSWTPANVNPSLWFRSDTGVIAATGSLIDQSRIVTWQDQSNNRQHANQLTSSKQPYYTENVARGIPGIRYTRENGGTLSLFSTGSQTYTNGFRNYVVTYLKPTDITAQGTAFGRSLVFGGGGATSIMTPCDRGTVTTSPSVTIFGSWSFIIAAATPSLTNNFSLQCFGYVNNTFSFRVDNILSSTPSNITPGNGTVVGLGTDGGTNVLVGHLCEVIMFNRKLTPEEDAAIINYLAEKYGCKWDPLRSYI